MLQSVRSNVFHLLKTERLLLEPVTSANVRRLWQLMRAPNLRDYQEIPRLPFERFEERLASRSPCLTRGVTGRFEWLIHLQATGDVLSHCPPSEIRENAVGWISVRIQEHRSNRGELGYSILAPFRRRGFATETVMAIIDLIFEGNVVDYVDAYCMPANLSSRRVLLRAGLRAVQRLPNGAFIHGDPVDVLRFEMKGSAWQRKRP